jgi:hypothetical protein
LATSGSRFPRLVVPTVAAHAVERREWGGPLADRTAISGHGADRPAVLEQAHLALRHLSLGFSRRAFRRSRRAKRVQDFLTFSARMARNDEEAVCWSGHSFLLVGGDLNSPHTALVGAFAEERDCRSFGNSRRCGVVEQLVSSLEVALVFFAALVPRGHKRSLVVRRVRVASCVLPGSPGRIRGYPPHPLPARAPAEACGTLFRVRRRRSVPLGSLAV